MVPILVIIEHDSQSLKPSSLNAVTLARQFGKAYALLVLGSNIAHIANSVLKFGASKVFVVDQPALTHPLADRFAAVAYQVSQQIGAQIVLGTSSTFTKDILPRVAAMMNAPMLTDVTKVNFNDGLVNYQRPIGAGSLISTVTLDSDVCVLTARGTAFDAPTPDGQTSAIESLSVDLASLPNGMQFVSHEKSTATRPDLMEARVVVSGGRPLKDRETFERLIGGLADAFGGAVGATRGAVDAGLASNDCQIGQTGKTVAPELYIAVGVSGAIQHSAGIKDSKVIVAINRDPEAPIFQLATYGLVGDLHDIVPRLTSAVRSQT